MSFRLVVKLRAEVESGEAFAWYDQADVQQGDASLAELERVERFIRLNPLLYPEVESAVRRAHLRRFPYSLFDGVDGEQISVQSCFHQHRDPQSKPDAGSAP